MKKGKDLSKRLRDLKKYTPEYIKFLIEEYMSSPFEKFKDFEEHFESNKGITWLNKPLIGPNSGPLYAPYKEKELITDLKKVWNWFKSLFKNKASK